MLERPYEHLVEGDAGNGDKSRGRVDDEHVPHPNEQTEVVAFLHGYTVSHIAIYRSRKTVPYM